MRRPSIESVEAEEYDTFKGSEGEIRRNYLIGTQETRAFNGNISWRDLREMSWKELAERVGQET